MRLCKLSNVVFEHLRLHTRVLCIQASLLHSACYDLVITFVLVVLFTSWQSSKNNRGPDSFCQSACCLPLCLSTCLFFHSCLQHSAYLLHSNLQSLPDRLSVHGVVQLKSSLYLTFAIIPVICLMPCFVCAVGPANKPANLFSPKPSLPAFRPAGFNFCTLLCMFSFTQNIMDIISSISCRWCQKVRKSDQ